MVHILLRGAGTHDLNMMFMQKSIAILVLASLAGLCGVQAQAPAPAPSWLNKLKLSGLSGSGQHRLALINNRTFSEGEVNDLKIAGQTVQLKCLEIGQETVIVQIQDTASRYELIMSGAAVPLESLPESAPPQQVVPVQPLVSTSSMTPTVPTRSPKPLGSSLPVSPPKAFSFTPLMFVGGIGLALLLGVALGAWVRRQRAEDGS
jgi:hypothetical protein